MQFITIKILRLIMFLGMLIAFLPVYAEMPSSPSTGFFSSSYSNANLKRIKDETRKINQMLCPRCGAPTAQRSAGKYICLACEHEISSKLRGDSAEVSGRYDNSSANYPRASQGKSSSLISVKAIVINAVLLIVFILIMMLYFFGSKDDLKD